MMVQLRLGQSQLAILFFSPPCALLFGLTNWQQALDEECGCRVVYQYPILGLAWYHWIAHMVIIFGFRWSEMLIDKGLCSTFVETNRSAPNLQYCLWKKTSKNGQIRPWRKTNSSTGSTKGSRLSLRHLKFPDYKLPLNALWLILQNGFVLYSKTKKGFRDVDQLAIC